MRINMEGRKFGSLTVEKKCAVYRGNDTQWLCRCDCGHYSIVRGSYLRNGHTKTCGNCARYFVEAGYIRCMTGSGRSFIFDADDYPIVHRLKWSVDRNGYVLSQDKGVSLKLHRLLTNAKAGEVVDHINGEPSDCRRANLRITTQHKNTFNARLPKSSTTGFKGVCFDKRKGKFMAHIHPNGKFIFLGYFDLATEAAHAYDRAASYYFGEYAKPNYKEETEIEQSEEVLGMEKSSRARSRPGA